MLNKQYTSMLQEKDVIFEIFQYATERAKVVGAENIYDFSLGNPNVPAPQEVEDSILETLKEEESTFIHGYMSNSGYEDVRETIACDLNRRFGTKFHQGNILMTVGAASGLNVILKTILNPQDQVVTFAPYFVEYGNYVRNYDGILEVVPADTETFQPDLEEFSRRITDRTKAVIINTPNNPTGVIYSEAVLTRLGEILTEKEKKFGTQIVLISDEPYRELAYDGAEVPYVTKFYHNTVICYSYSKSLSLPGERIGYLVIPDELTDSKEVFNAAVIANRVMGAVNAPSLMQRVVMRCVDETADIEAYDRNRNLLYRGLREAGFECVKPQGAFYMFVKSPEPDEKKFCDTVRPPCLHRKFQSILRIKQLIQLCQDRVNVLCRQSSWGSASKVDGIQRASLHLVCHIFHFLK